MSLCVLQKDGQQITSRVNAAQNEHDRHSTEDNWSEDKRNVAAVFFSDADKTKRKENTIPVTLPENKNYTATQYTLLMFKGEEGRAYDTSDLCIVCSRGVTLQQPQQQEQQQK